MSKESCTKERFLQDTKDHKLTILKDDGVFRHIVMSRGGSVYQYEITTFPQHLCYTGDMGSFVFRRVEDMFKFFRQDVLQINPGYWHEKCEAAERDGGAMRYSSELFEGAVKEYFDMYVVDTAESKKTQDEIWADIKRDIFYGDDNSADLAFSRILQFESNGFVFEDFYPNVQEYSYRFIWCLYAVVYAIQQYDKTKT